MKALQPLLKNSELQNYCIFWLMPCRCIANMPQWQHPGDRTLNSEFPKRCWNWLLENFLGAHSGAELIQNTETLHSWRWALPLADKWVRIRNGSQQLEAQQSGTRQRCRGISDEVHSFWGTVQETHLVQHLALGGLPELSWNRQACDLFFRPR